MPETPAQTARRRAKEQRMLSGAGAADVARRQMEQANPLSNGYTRGTEPTPAQRQIGPPPEPAAPGFFTESPAAEKARKRREAVLTGEPIT